jgi:hypothetical protein
MYTWFLYWKKYDTKTREIFIYWPPRYNWNIVESGVKHHQTNKQTNKHILVHFVYHVTYTCRVQLTHCQTIFQLTYIVAVSFIGGGNRSTQKKQLTCHKALTNQTIHWGKLHWTCHPYQQVYNTCVLYLCIVNICIIHVCCTCVLWTCV